MVDFKFVVNKVTKAEDSLRSFSFGHQLLNVLSFVFSHPIDYPQVVFYGGCLATVYVAFALTGAMLCLLYSKCLIGFF